MSNWVRISERMPTKEDCCPNGLVIVTAENEASWWTVHYTRKKSYKWEAATHWLDSELPPLPTKLRTVEDVVKDLLKLYETYDYCDCYGAFDDLMEDLKQITNPKYIRRPKRC